MVIKLQSRGGTVHDYLGMDLDYSLDGKVQVSMIKYVDKVFRDFPEQIRKSSSTPAADHLLTIRDPEETEKEGKWLSEEQVQHFIMPSHSYCLYQ
jgi:hypothetical protein